MFRFLGLCTLLYAFTFSSPDESFFQYMQRNQVSDLTIIADYTWLTKNKYKDTSVDCSLKWVVEGKSMSLKGELSLRGKTRRRICDFPPIKLNLSKKELKAMGLNGSVDEYKLVQPCKIAENNADLLQRELLAYQILNLIDSSTFLVHPLRVTLKKDNGTSIAQHPAFFLESEEEIGLRLGLTPVETLISESGLSQETHLRLALYQLLVGNDDWDLNAKRNVFILNNTAGKIVPIAYDFDFSGLVNAPYARPNPNLPPHTLKDRVYMGPAVDAATWTKVKDDLLGQRDKVLELLKNTETVSATSRRDITPFVKSFFTNIKSNKPIAPKTVFQFVSE